MEKKLNYVFDEKSTQIAKCMKCENKTVHLVGLAWNHDLKLYFSVLKCKNCEKKTKKRIGFGDFKEAKSFMALPS